MKKKILIFAVMIIAIMSVFVISASAAEQSYTTFEVTLTDGTTKTAYSAGSDKYEGRIYINAKLYAEAPKDSDGTYEEIDWSTVKEIDFSKSMVYFYENDTWKEMAYGLNQSNTALCVMPNGVTVANLFTSLEKVITGKIVVVRGKSFNGCPKLKEIVFSNGIKEIQYNAFDFNTALTTLDFSACTTLTSIGQQAFKGCTSLVNVTLPNTVTSMGTSVFENCTALKTINWPTSMTKIPGSTFSGCSMLAAFAISSNITEIGSSAFKTCTSLTSVYIPASVTSIGSDCWRGCSGVTSIEFHPDCSVQKIFPHTFDSTKVTQIKLPNTVTSIAQSSFAISTLESVWLGKSFVDFNAGNAGQPPFSSGNTLKYVYLPSTFTASSVRGGVFSWNDNNANEYNKKYIDLTFFYTGTKEQAQAIIDAANGDYAVAGDGTVTGARVNTYIATMNLISAENYKKAVADGTLETGVSGTPKRYLVYDYNLCEAFYNNQHIIKDSNDCTEDGDCDRCKVEAIVKGFETHNYLETFTYPNGFAQNGVYIKVCQNLATCTCGNITEGENTVKKPMFSALAENGYSTNGTGISFGGYVVDTDALKEFNNVNKDAKLTFGVVILNPKYLGETFFDENGNVNATKGYIKVDFSDTEYRNIKVMIDGFNTLSAKETELVIALYAYTDEAKVEFIQSEDTASASTSVTKGETSLYTVSVNSVMNKPNASVDALPPYENKENA